MDGIHSRVDIAEEQISKCECMETAKVKQEKRTIKHKQSYPWTMGQLQSPNIEVMQSLYERESSTEKNI